MTRPDRDRWPPPVETPQIHLAAAGRITVRPGGGYLYGPCSIHQRPPPGVGETRDPRDYGIRPVQRRQIRVLEAGEIVFWWWEGDLPQPVRPGQQRFEMG